MKSIELEPQHIDKFELIEASESEATAARTKRSAAIEQRQALEVQIRVTVDRMKVIQQVKQNFIHKNDIEDAESNQGIDSVSE